MGLKVLGLQVRILLLAIIASRENVLRMRNSLEVATAFFYPAAAIVWYSGKGQGRAVIDRGLKDLIKEAQKEIESQGTVAFSPRTTSLTVVRPRAQKPADERFFGKLESEVRSTPGFDS